LLDLGCPAICHGLPLADPLALNVEGCPQDLNLSCPSTLNISLGNGCREFPFKPLHMASQYGQSP
jgi:hypothetical protein